MNMSESITGSPMEDQSILVYVMVRSLKIVGHSMNFIYHRKRKKKILQLYFYHPKFYGDIEWKRLRQGSINPSTSESDNDNINFDYQTDDVLEPIDDYIEVPTNLYPF